MRNRVGIWVALAVLAAALGGLAVVAGGDADEEPAVLPVLGAAGGGTAADAAAESSTMRAPDAGVVEYRYEGEVPDLPGTAAAWGLGRGDVTIDDVEALAAVLGVTGPVQEADHAWTVEGDGVVLEVQRVPGAPWNLYRTDGVAVDTGTAVACAPDGCGSEPMPEPERPAGLPDREEAEHLAVELLDGLGVSRDGLRVDDGFSVWNASVEPTVGGLPVLGMATSVGIGVDGRLEFANGWLGAPERGDDYPLIGVEAALDRLRDEQVRILGAPEPLVAECVDCPETESTVVTLGDVRLGLQLLWGGDESYLVPSYLFRAEEGFDLPVVAVDDRFLAPPPAEEPQGDPSVPPPVRPPGEIASVCSGSASGSEGGGAPQGPTVELCHDVPVRAGEPFVLRVSATDPDSGIRDDCGSPVVTFGDEGDVAVCDIGCDDLGTEPGSVERSYEHVYAEPGTYTVTVTFTGCGPEYAVEGQARTDVTVEP